MIRINDTIINQGHFPDGTLLTKFDPYDPELQYEAEIRFEWIYENDAELFTLICLKRHIDHFFGNDAYITLYMPYIPNARMDRVKNADEVFTLKYFCEVINSLHFDAVLVLDAHSNVSLALLNNVVALTPVKQIERVMNMCGDPALFFPDEGAMKRYSEQIHAPYAFGVKKRDWETGKIMRLDLIFPENVKDKDVLIVDDICSYGGTFLHSAKALKEAGANKIFLFVTHCEQSIFNGEMINSGLISKIYTTDSLFPRDKQNDIIKIVD
jgi:ribose-phosphate pyrophosphokinase